MFLPKRNTLARKVHWKMRVVTLAALLWSSDLFAAECFAISGKEENVLAKP
jgi:hypothetical protein